MPEVIPEFPDEYPALTRLYQMLDDPDMMEPLRWCGTPYTLTQAMVMLRGRIDKALEEISTHSITEKTILWPLRTENLKVVGITSMDEDTFHDYLKIIGYEEGE